MVTSIGFKAFSDYEALVSVDIPEDVHTIWDFAFDGCIRMESISIPDSVVSTGYRVFYGCSNLEEINLSSFNTENIENMSYMFMNCNNLKKIIFSPSFSTKNVNVMTGMFYYCEKLEF